MLSENIKWCRSTLGLNQMEFAVKLGLKSYTPVWAWENEKAIPRPRHIESMAALIGLPEPGLFHGIDLSKYRWKGKPKG